MSKNKNHHDQGIFDDEEGIREHTRVVRAPRLEPKVKEAMMQPIKKEKGTNAKPKKGKIPLM